MLWPVLTLLALAALPVVHLRWRARFLDAKDAADARMDALREAQRRDSVQLQAQQRALLDSMVEGLLVLDERGRITLANRAFTSFFGVAADIRGRTILEAVRLHELDESIEPLRTQAESLGTELQLSRPVDRWLQINGAVVRDGAGRRQGLILVFHDLTRVKELENQRKDFVANVSHELRTPLSLIQGYVETLLDGAKDDPAVAARFLGTIERNTARLRRLIEDLLIVSELESGCVKLNVQPVALSAVVAKVFEDFRPAAAAAGVELRAAVPEVALKADAGRLEQVLTNLVDNAIKYGREGGLVIVEARPAPDGFLEICVRDRGPGIAAADLPRLFERFYRVDRARSRDQGGTGLGLSIVKHIVQCHGGRVRAESRLGEGSAFYFTLPVEAGHPEQAEASGQPAVAGSAPLP